MSEETQLLERAKTQVSRLFNMSVRSWIALTFTLSVCFTYVYSVVVLEVPIDEPFKTLATVAIGFYFGHAIGQATKAQ